MYASWPRCKIWVTGSFFSRFLQDWLGSVPVYLQQPLKPCIGCKHQAMKSLLWSSLYDGLGPVLSDPQWPSDPPITLEGHSEVLPKLKPTSTQTIQWISSVPTCSISYINGLNSLIWLLEIVGSCVCANSTIAKVSVKQLWTVLWL